MTDRSSRPTWPLDPQAPQPPAPSRLQIDLSIDNERLGGVTALLVDILTRVKRIESAYLRIETQGAKTMVTLADAQAKLDALHADLEDETNVVLSVETLLTSNTDQIRQLRADLAAAIAAGGDTVALQAILDQIDAVTALQDQNKARTVAAVFANTPVDPNAPPATAPIDPNAPAAKA